MPDVGRPGCISHGSRPLIHLDSLVWWWRTKRLVGTFGTIVIYFYPTFRPACFPVNVLA
jgi:hypothetical protein